MGRWKDPMVYADKICQVICRSYSSLWWPLLEELCYSCFSVSYTRTHELVAFEQDLVETS